MSRHLIIGGFIVGVIALSAMVLVVMVFNRPSSDAGEISARPEQVAERQSSAEKRVSGRNRHQLASNVAFVDLSPVERRLHSEETLEEAGLAAREKLLARQTRRLSELAEQAERDGNTERARLMRRRIDYLVETP